MLDILESVLHFRRNPEKVGFRLHSGRSMKVTHKKIDKFDQEQTLLFLVTKVN